MIPVFNRVDCSDWSGGLRTAAWWLGLIVGGALAVVPVRGAPAKAPAWVRDVAAAPAGAAMPKVAGVVLLEQAFIEVLPGGGRSEHTRRVVRVNTRDGRDLATARVAYTVGGGKVESAQAWLIRPDGSVRLYPRKEFFDVAQYEGELYSEARALTLPAGAEAEPGSVFAWETVTTNQSIFPEGAWTFASEHPVIVSRLTVRLPAGWRVDGRVFNHPSLTPRVAGQDTTWELMNLPAIEEEPWAASPVTRVPVLAYSFVPPAGGASKVKVRRFETWSDVSQLLAELGDPAVVVDASVQARAGELTRGLTAERDRIAAIARFVQRINYVSISMRLHSGGGLTPHAAPQVLKCGYGDCKDKATLMRALLRAIGIDSHYVGVASETQPVIWREWPSPSQFNHAIIAVKVPAEVTGDAVVDEPALGRLLFFDPTDPYTSFGDLPGHYQGSAALVVAGRDGRLVDIPIIPAASNSFRRAIQGRIFPDGSIEAQVTEASSGQAATSERALLAGSTPTEYARTTTSWVTNTVRGAKVEQIEPRDDVVAGTFDLSLKVSAPAYAQSMGGRLLVFKPVLLSRRSFTPLTAARRVNPVWIQGRTMAEEISLDLPEGYEVSETGESVSLQESFGEYALSFAHEGGRLRVTRALTLRTTTVPAADYARVREFFVKVIRAEQQPVVLERSSP